MNQLKTNWRNYWYYNGRLNRANLIKTPFYIGAVIFIAIFFGLGFIAVKLTGLIIDGYAPQKDKEEVELAMGFFFGMGHLVVVLIHLDSIGVLR